MKWLMAGVAALLFVALSGCGGSTSKREATKGEVTKGEVTKGDVPTGDVSKGEAPKKGGASPATMEGIWKDSIQVANEMADTLESIKDKETAKAALPKMRKLAERVKDIYQRRRDYDEAGGLGGGKLSKKYGPVYGKAAERVIQAEGKVKDLNIPEGDEAVKLARPLPMDRLDR